jgi:hypothetical protein
MTSHDRGRELSAKTMSPDDGHDAQILPCEWTFSLARSIRDEDWRKDDMFSHYLLADFIFSLRFVDEERIQFRMPLFPFEDLPWERGCCPKVWIWMLYWLMTRQKSPWLKSHFRHKEELVAEEAVAEVGDEDRRVGFFYYWCQTLGSLLFLYVSMLTTSQCTGSVCTNVVSNIRFEIWNAEWKTNGG